MVNKKGVQGPVTIQMFLFVVVAFLVIVFLGIYVFVFDLVTTNIGVDIDVGQVNLQNITNSTLGQLNIALGLNADILGIILLLMMSVVMILNGFFLGRGNSRLWIIGDIFILVFVFILSVYIAQIYDTFINATTLLDVYINDLPKSSTFILNLPTYVATIGALIMIVSYSAISEARRGEANVLGFEQ
ncbi:hypothetical protein LCGC14_1497210 [marine sediment metagenome]|uniref:Uncharacterized protein n=1 Tax=marine sediment metagenome TaxID=412755 RepID=A0A0F9J547_9ZZZZ